MNCLIKTLYISALSHSREVGKVLYEVKNIDVLYDTLIFFLLLYSHGFFICFFNMGKSPTRSHRRKMIGEGILK